MSLKKLSKDGSVHVTDEVFNTLISGIGAVLAIIGVGYLLTQSIVAGRVWHIVSFSIYGVGVLSVFVSSALHHGIDGSDRTEYLLRQLDYCVIFVMIAGTFTPFCLIFLSGNLGFILLIILWTLALSGIVIKIKYPDISKLKISCFFIGMGWIAVFIFRPILQIIGWEGMSFLLIGGLIYTIGAVIFLIEKPNPFPGKFGFHEIWHLFVLSGTAAHYVVMVCYVLPYSVDR
jgi:hemolysin III